MYVRQVVVVLCTICTHSCMYVHAIVIHTLFVHDDCVYMRLLVITKPPENTTVCRGNAVTISCGYRSPTPLPVTWIINGTSFTQQEVVDSPLYQLNNPTSPSIFTLTALSINGTTTFQCMIHSTPSITSTLGTITVTTGK